MTNATLARTADTSAPPGALAVDLLGIGTALPPRVVTNHDLAQVLDTDDEWIRSRTGIAQRHVASGPTPTTDLALAAARAALTDAGVDPSALGAVVVATTTPDRRLPGVAVSVAGALGVTCAAFDVQAVCAGFVTALRVAAPLVTADAPVLVVGAETMTRVVDPGDRATAVLFGDGAAAVVLGTGRGGSLGPFDLGSDGTHGAILEVPPGEQHLVMEGGEVYRQAVTTLTASTHAVLAAAGLDVDDVDVFVGHQANLRILTAVGRRLGLPLARQQLCVAEHGNTSAASVPLALAAARDAGRLHPGARVLLSAFGAGLTWASCLLTVGDDR